MDESVSINIAKISQSLNLKSQQIQSVVELLDDGNTVPFITRYRKEKTGNLDEVQIRAIAQAVKPTR